MVAKAHFNPFAVFIRKIGYSVGLEATLERLDDFAKIYAAKEQFKYSDLNNLLHSEKPVGWGLKNEHIIDVLKSLDVLSLHAGEVNILEIGDTLGILRRMQSLDCFSFSNSLKFLFTETLIRADGDIFLNALAASFDPDEFTERLKSLLEYKWSILGELFKSPQQRSAIYQSVNIEVQENNKGSRGEPFNKLASMNNPFNQKHNLLQPFSFQPIPRISSAYLKKALPRRKAWAVSLGLANEDGNSTKLGQLLLSKLSSIHFTGPGCMSVWPLKHELSSPNFIGLKFPPTVKILTTWEYLLVIGQAYGFIKQNAIYTEQEHDKIINLILEIKKTYHSLNINKSMVRTELPGRIALRCALCMSTPFNGVPNILEILEVEQKKPRPRITLRQSKVAEFALSS
jgi:hypothetical protein